MPKSIRPAPDEAARSGLRSIAGKRRLARISDSVDRVSVRMVGVVAVIYLLLSVSLGFQWGIILTVVVIALMGIAKGILRNTELAIGLGSLIVTIGVMGVGAPSLVQYGSLVHPSSFLVAIAAVPGAFLSARHRGNRGVTIVMIHLGCILTTFLSAFDMDWAGYLIVLWALLVLVWRGGFGLWVQVQLARFRSGLSSPHGNMIDVAGFRDRLEGSPDRAVTSEAFTDENIERGAAAEEETVRALEALPSQWSLLVSRKLPTSRADVDLLAVGPGGVWNVDTKDWSGKVTSRRVADPTSGEMGTEYLLNGSSSTLTDRLAPATFEARRVAETLRISPESVGTVVCFSDRMALPEDVVSLQLFDVWDVPTQTTWNPVVHLVRRPALVDFLVAQPDVMWREPSRWEKSRAKRAGVSDDQLQEQVNARSALDVAVVADYALIPA